MIYRNRFVVLLPVVAVMMLSGALVSCSDDESHQLIGPDTSVVSDRGESGAPVEGLTSDPRPTLPSSEKDEPSKSPEATESRVSMGSESGLPENFSNNGATPGEAGFMSHQTWALTKWSSRAGAIVFDDSARGVVTRYYFPGSVAEGPEINDESVLKVVDIKGHPNQGEIYARVLESRHYNDANGGAPFAVGDIVKLTVERGILYDPDGNLYFSDYTLDSANACNV